MSIYSLILELVGKDRGATQSLKSVKKEIGGLESACQKLQGGLMAAAGLAGMAYMGRQALDLVGDLYMLGAQAMRTERAFNELAKGAGGSGDAIVAAIKEASGGTISSMNAMAAANRGMLLGLGASEQQWEKLTQVARYRARAMGLSVTQALDDITTGIGRESRMILDNLGIVLDLDAVMRQYASTVGKTADELDALERKQAIVNGIIAETERTAEDAGVDLSNLAKDPLDDVETLQGAWEELKIEVGKTVAEWELGRQAIQGLANVLRGDAPEVFTENVTGAKKEVRELRHAIDDLADARAQLVAMEGPEGWWSPQEIAAVKGRIAELEAELNKLLTTAYGLVPWLSDMGTQIGNVGKKAAEAAPKVHALVSAYMMLSEETKTWVGERMKADLYAMDPYDVDPEGALAAIEKQRADIAAAEKALADEAKRNAEDWARAWTSATEEYRRNLDIITSLQEAQGLYRKGRGGLDAALLGIADVAPASTINKIREEYQAALRSLYDGVYWQIREGGEVSKWWIELQEQMIYEEFKGVIGAIEDSTGGIEDALKDQQAAWENLKSTVEAALQPTQVTALDMYQTEMGKYVDKWDEDARRLDAIAARGFAELEAHPDWAEALAIPPEILGANEEVLKEWARQQSDLARNLMLPMDKDQIAAAVDQVHQYILQEAQRKKNIEAVALAYQAEYGGTEEQARAALGDTEAIGGIAADDVIAGFTDALMAATPAAQFVNLLRDETDGQTQNLRNQGLALWDPVEKGIKEGIDKGDYIDYFAQKLAGPVADEIQRRHLYTGGASSPP